MAVFGSNVPDFFREGERLDFEAFLLDLPGPYLVVERTGTVVGCGGYAVRAGEGIADLCWGMIRRELHGVGLGTLLTTRRLGLALRDSAVRSVSLRTSQHTVGFYEKLGFTVASVLLDGFGPGLDRCEMTLDATRELPPG